MCINTQLKVKKMHCLLHFVRFCSNDQRKQLVAQTNPKDGFGILHTCHLPYVLYSLLTVLWISRAIADEQPIKV